MKKLILLPLIIFVSCSSNDKKHEITDLDRYNLSGNVTSFKIECYDESGTTKLAPYIAAAYDMLAGQYDFNEAGNLTRVRWENPQQNQSITISYSYGDAGKLAQVSVKQLPQNPYYPYAASYDIKYDEKGRPMQGVSPMRGLVDYQYIGDAKYPYCQQTSGELKPNSTSLVQEIDSLNRIKNEARTTMFANGMSTVQHVVYSYNEKGDIQDMRFVDDTNNVNAFRNAQFFEYSAFDEHSNWTERKVTTLNFGGSSSTFVQKRIITYK